MELLSALPAGLSAYPALVAGMAIGYLVARLGWRAMPLLLAGVAVLAVATAHQSTVPAPGGGPWTGPIITARLWGLIAAVNAGSWALGIGIGVALDSTSRRHRTAPASRR